MIHLDTHVVIWLALRRSHRLSARARALIERDESQISPMVMLELEILFESGRIDRDAASLIERLSGRIELAISETPLPTIVDRARSFAWTRDPFDRLIVAHAMAEKARLISADATILDNFAGAVW